MNNVQKFPHLEEWCKNYHETSGLKVHPSSVPVDVVLDDLMGQVVLLIHNQKNMTSIIEFLTQKLFATEVLAINLQAQVDELTKSLAEPTPEPKKEKAKK